MLSLPFKKYKEIDSQPIGLFGNDGCKPREVVDLAIVVPHSVTQGRKRPVFLFCTSGRASWEKNCAFPKTKMYPTFQF